MNHASRRTSQVPGKYSAVHAVGKCSGAATAAIACGIHLPVPDTAPVDLLVGEIVRERNQFKLVLSPTRCGKIFLGRCEKAIDQPYLV